MIVRVFLFGGAMLAAVCAPAQADSPVLQACKTFSATVLLHPGTPRGDAAFTKALEVLPTVPSAERYDCARSIERIEASPTIYSTRARAAIIALLASNEPMARVDAARALWGSMNPDDGAALLATASTDASPDVIYAAFANMSTPAHVDIVRQGNSLAYDAAISRALASTNARIVGGALIARVGIHSIEADAATRPFANDPRPFVRRSAIDSYDLMMTANVDIARFVEGHLNDPDPDVRSSVMLRLFRWGYHHAVPAIARLAKTAPTKAERDEAADYVRGFKTQPEMFAPPNR